MGSYDDVFPLQPPVRLPPEDELAAAARVAPLAAEILTGPRAPGGEAADRRPPGERAPDSDAPDKGAPDGGVPDGEVLRVWAEACRERLDEGLLLELVRLFIAREPAAGRPPAELVALGLVSEADPYELTPLGVWTGRHLIAEVTGQEVPVMGSLAGRDAAELLNGLRAYPEPERDEELAGWLSRRDPAGAVRQVAAVLPRVSPLSRAVGIELLATRLGPEGREALDELVIEPKLGAVIAARLGRADRQPATEEIGWVLVDMAAALLEFGGEANEVIESVAKGMDTDGQAGTITLLALCDHPHTEAVLRVFIDHHPRDQVRAAARKALRRLRGLTEARG